MNSQKRQKTPCNNYEKCQEMPNCVVLASCDDQNCAELASLDDCLMFVCSVLTTVCLLCFWSLKCAVLLDALGIRMRWVLESK